MERRSASYVEATTDAAGSEAEPASGTRSSTVRFSADALDHDNGGGGGGAKTTMAKVSAVGDVEAGCPAPPREESERRFGPHRHGLVGNALLWWNFSLIRHGWRHTLTADELPGLAKR